MIPRYSRPEMVSIWEPQTRFKIWFEIEAHAADALAELGVIPKDAARTIWAKARDAVFNVERIDEITQQFLKHGAKPETPVALTRWATTGRQSTIEGTLSTIAQVIKDNPQVKKISIEGHASAEGDAKAEGDGGERTPIARRRDSEPPIAAAMAPRGRRRSVSPRRALPAAPCNRNS